jgi:hypothetical protein
MKLICLALAAACVCSCNTTIGLGRDIKEGFIWSKNKIQEKRQESQQSSAPDDSGAPVY